MTASSSIHMLVERPIVETTPDTFPSVIFRDLPATELGAHVVVTIMGSADERQAFAADLRAAADFVETWELPAESEPVEEAAVPA